jgi:DNA phosphorothioation-associated putative methyltransferase
MPEIARHRTALIRSNLSRPVRLALDDGIITDGMTVMDYGCGHGGDIDRLRARGFDCVGWDPNHRQSGARRRSGVVNLSYVVNVIEDASERNEALRAAWALAEHVLVVAARLKADLGESEPGEAFADGRLTRLQTFQKFYDQQELRAWIDGVLQTACVAAAPGVFYVFRSEARREAHLAARMRRVIAAPRVSGQQVLLQTHRDAFKAFGAFLADRGRLPAPDELPEFEELVAAAGSISRAFRALDAGSDAGAWDSVKNARSQDLAIYLALARFDRRPNLSNLSIAMQRDVKAFFGSYVAACKAADALLFSLGKQGAIDAACRAATVGKLMPTALYLHMSALSDAPVSLRLFEGCARAYYGAIDGANVIKLSRVEPKVTYLSYPDFDTDPHPVLRWSVSVNMQTFRSKQRSYAADSNAPILHRKELFVASSYPLRDKFKRLTESEERWGLYDEPSTIGFTHGWAETLRARQVELRGHRVVRSATRARPQT